MSKTSSDLRRLKRGGFDIESNVKLATRTLPQVAEKGEEDAQTRRPPKDIRGQDEK